MDENLYLISKQYKTRKLLYFIFSFLFQIIQLQVELNRHLGPQVFFLIHERRGLHFDYIKSNTDLLNAVNSWKKYSPEYEHNFFTDQQCDEFMQKNFKGIEHYSADKLISWARELRKRINEKYEFVHPENETINGCSHILWTGAVLDKTSTARNAVFYGDKAIDRSPCGTGTSARMAQWYAKGKLKKGDLFIHESIIGSKFIGTIEEECFVANKPAIKPGIEGWAKIYGQNIITINTDDDPYALGFQVL